MKGLYCRAGVSDAEPRFIIQETTLPDVLDQHQVRVQVKACGLSPLDLKLLSDVGIQRDLIPVGREVAGVVLQVGPKVTFFQPDDEVVGILPLDSPCSGLCDIIDVDEHYLVQKPEKLSSVSVAGALRDGLCAYTALHTHARISAGHTLLVMDGASPFGLLCIQLACYHGVKVLTTSHSPQKHTFLEQLRPSVGVQDPLVARVIPVYNGSDLLPVVLEETGGLGVDIVVDSGGDACCPFCWWISLMIVIGLLPWSPPLHLRVHHELITSVMIPLIQTVILLDKFSWICWSKAG
ncbi:quinone oxidoreductase-like protein 1 isoform X3 [Mugil cephalus]|uniref:quinone oxidoreductase-like protein 1 isoform X3 n=1 Tax=Mugil cephalus TaxID=48193 RepID=UPI001FB7869F|nr:quinone oxidoreductase-like protein 1 isoform X3 [Mugil cephalus]